MENFDFEKNWYVVNTYASHENKVKDNLENRRIHIHNSFFGNKDKNMTYSIRIGNCYNI